MQIAVKHPVPTRGRDAFATHIGSAIEVAESIEILEHTNRELAVCNAELARAQAELIERERLAALGELAAVVAHEVRNPLCVLINAIGGLRDFLQAGMPPAKLADAEAFAAMAAEEAATGDPEGWRRDDPRLGRAGRGCFVPSGTGLGLALVKRVVEAHGGELAVESSAAGTRFRVMLPAARA